MSPMVRRPPGIEIALLGFLRNGSQHGYQINQLLADPSGLGPIWRLKQSQLYALLTKLEKDGYIWGELMVQTAARPPRRVFQLTIAGLAAYLNWLQSPVSVPRQMRQEFMAKLYFARQDEPEKVKRLIALQRTTCQGWLAAMRTEAVEPASFNSLIHQYRIGQIEAMLAWLETCQHEFN